jgi:hypothetical protein
MRVIGTANREQGIRSFPQWIVIISGLGPQIGKSVRIGLGGSGKLMI